MALFLVWEDPAEIVNRCFCAHIIFTISERGFVLVLSLGSGYERGKDDAKLFSWQVRKSGCSQCLFSSLALYLWRPLATHVVSKTSALPRGSSSLDRGLSIALLNCKAVKSRLTRFKRECLLQKSRSFCLLFCILMFTKGSTRSEDQQLKKGWHSWVVLYVSILACHVPFSIRAFQNSAWKFDSALCWLHYTQRTVIFS